MYRFIFKKHLLLFISTLALIGAAIAAFCVFHSSQISSVKNISAVATSTKEDFSAELDTIQAKSFYVYDMVTGQALFTKNEHQQLPLASVAKLMTSEVIAENMPASTTITITAQDVLKRYDTGDLGLLWGERWTRDDLLNYSLMTSSNDGMQALARTLDTTFLPKSTTTVSLMNDEAHELGLSDSFFFNVSGLDISPTLSGAYGSSHDVALLLGDMLKENPSVLMDTTKVSATFTSENKIVHHAVNTDALIPGIPSLLGSKTGYTDLAGGNLAIAFDAGLAHPVAIVVLGSTEDARFTDVATLVDVTLKSLSQ